MRTARLANPATSALRGLLVWVGLCGGFAHAQTFSTPAALATGGLAGYRVSSAIDANADAIALWSGEYSDRSGVAGAWTPKQSFGGTGSPTQTVRMTAGGAATAVWVDSARNIMTADLPLGGTWSARGIEGFLLGSQTQKVLTYTHIPVLVYR